MTTSAELLNVLTLQAQVAEYTNLQIHWGRLQESMTKKVQIAQGYEKTYEDAYDKATEESEAKKDFVVKDKVFIAKGSTVTEADAIRYAKAKAPQYDPVKLAELEDLEIEYEEISTMYETLMEQVKGQLDTDKQHLTQEAGTNYMIGGQ